MTSKKQLAFNLSSTFLRQVGITVFQLAFTVLLARNLGKDNYGAYALALMLPQLLMKILNLGLGSSVVYFLARKELSIKNAIFKVVQLSAFTTVLALLADAIIIFLFGDTFFQNVPTNALILASVLFPVLILQELLPNIFLGLQKFSTYNVSYVVFPVFSLIIVWLMILFYNFDVTWALGAFGAGQFISILTLLILLKREQLREIDEVTSVSWSQLLSFSWKIHAANIVGFLNYRIDIFLVNFLANTATVGIYFIAVQIAEKLWLLSQAVNTAVFPHLSQKYKRSKLDTSATEILGSTTFLLTILASIILTLCANAIIKTFFGEVFIEASVVLIYLLPGIIATSVGRILSNDFSARGEPQLNIYVGLFTVISNVIANLYFIPKMGARGAALATSLSYGLSLIIKLFIYFQLVKVPFWRVLFPGKALIDIGKSIIANRKII
jgi:O-antigen/teichoic acid export membrane protein